MIIFIRNMNKSIWCNCNIIFMRTYNIIFLIYVKNLKKTSWWYTLKNLSCIRPNCKQYSTFWFLYHVDKFLLVLTLTLLVFKLLSLVVIFESLVVKVSSRQRRILFEEDIKFKHKLQILEIYELPEIFFIIRTCK